MQASIPTLDEVGLGALIALVAGVAGWAIRKRSRR
ncbi:MAG: IPTL-CTERM sorting domain-containing protein [Burkholderiales bacterium]|nr:IPTL-CTERM sorting domain-containing protein [Burkholderiales bacterium]